MKRVSGKRLNTVNYLTGIIFISLSFLSACGGGVETVDSVLTTENKAPSVNAGRDQSVNSNSEVQIVASASDSDGTIESYTWEQISGTSVTIIGASTANASFVAPETTTQSTELVFRITATDNNGATAVDTVDIIVTQRNANQAPTVNAGQDRSVQIGETVEIIATASDIDGTIQSINWIQSNGPDLDIFGASSLNLSFVAPTFEDNNLQLSFTIVVTDNDGLTAVDEINITVLQQSDNQSPEVDAGQDQTVQEGDNVDLVASASDIDGTVDAYAWSQLSGESVNILSASSIAASFIAPTVTVAQGSLKLSFQVLVTDDDGAISTDSIDIDILAVVDNLPPTVDAGSDQFVKQQRVVQLTAIASDADGTIASYQWTQISGMSVSLDSSLSADTTFTSPNLGNPDIAETLIFSITVIDNEGLEATDTISITIEPELSSASCDQTIGSNDSLSSIVNSMTSGETLCLNDGIYTQGLTVPSGITVRAVNRGGAEFVGGDSEWSGIMRMQGTGSTIDGLKVHHPDNFSSDACLVNGSNNTMKNTSCSHGGSHKHKIPLKVGGTGHLIEDSWFFGEGRYVVQCFVGDNITFRRNVARWDSTTPNETSEPNAAFSIYNCSEITIENNISLDYGIPTTAMRFGGDFYSPQHASAYPTGNQNNHWLGNMAINHAELTDNRRGLRLDPDTNAHNNVVRDFYVRGSDRAFLSNDKMIGLEISDCTLIDVGTVGSIPNQGPIDCGTGADLSVRYENRTKTTVPLFPWPNEARIKADMCSNGERQSDLCSSGKTLSDYVLDR